MKIDKVAEIKWILDSINKLPRNNANKLCLNKSKLISFRVIKKSYLKVYVPNCDLFIAVMQRLGMMGTYFSIDLGPFQAPAYKDKIAYILISDYDDNEINHPFNFYGGDGQIVSQKQVKELDLILQNLRETISSLMYHPTKSHKFIIYPQSKDDFLTTMNALGKVGAYFSFDFLKYRAPEPGYEDSYARIIVIDYDQNWSENAQDFQ